MNNKVVYAWLNAGIPFYIGIGSLKRPQSTKNRNKYCSNKRAKSEKNNCFEIRILHVNLSWKEACEIEQSLISLYGRVDNGTGILTNMTDGGEGQCNPSKETREKLQAASIRNPKFKAGAKGKDNHMYGRTKEQNPFYGKTHSQETKDNWSKIRKDRPAHNRKQCKTPLGLFNSVTAACKAHSLSRGAMTNRLKSNNYPEYRFTNGTSTNKKSSSSTTS